jgi:hypothetical protein
VPCLAGGGEAPWAVERNIHQQMLRFSIITYAMRVKYFDLLLPLLLLLCRVISHSLAYTNGERCTSHHFMLLLHQSAAYIQEYLVAG